MEAIGLMSYQWVRNPDNKSGCKQIVIHSVLKKNEKGRFYWERWWPPWAKGASQEFRNCGKACQALTEGRLHFSGVDIKELT